MRSERAIRAQIDDLQADIQKMQQLYSDEQISHEELLDGVAHYQGYVECFLFALGDAEMYGRTIDFLET